MFIWTAHSTKQVFQNARPGRSATADIVVDTPRNAYAAAQVIVRDIVPVHITGISVKRTGGKPAPRDGRVRIFRECTTVYNDRTAYPDRLAEIVSGSRLSLRIPAHCAQTFLIDFYTPEGAAPGPREYTVAVKTEGGQAEAKIVVNVHTATLSAPAGAPFGHEYFFNTALLPKEAGVKRYTEAWWQLLTHCAEVMRELRNNVICVPLKELLTRAGSRKNADGTYTFCWEIFDRYVNTFIASGAAREFTLNAPIQSVEGRYLDAIGPDGASERFETLTADAEQYLRALYGAVWQHLKAQGWEQLFRAHIEDEPHTTEAWLWADRIIHAAAPGLTTGEPLDMIESARVITETAHWAVPRINVHDEDPELFRKYVDCGGELWLYSCCFPEEAWWLNKFVDLPFIRSRLMEWACLGVGARGFLHWGFNYWGTGDSLYGFNPDARFKGDGAIVYPDLRRKKLAPGLRFINSRDGNQDADLFMQVLASGDAGAAEAARELLARTTGGCFTSFSDDELEFDAAYRELLALADRVTAR